MNFIEVSLSGVGKVFNIHAIMRPNAFKKTKFPADMIAAGIIGPPIEVAVIIRKLSVIVNGRHLRKSKGPYDILNDYFSSFLPSPAVCYEMDEVEFAQTFKIPLKEGEKFSPKKLQLVKSIHEPPTFDYGILYNIIKYDGNIIEGDVAKPYSFNSQEAYPSYPFVYWDPAGY